MDYPSTPSIGLTLFGGCRESMDDILKRADVAMYEAKYAGRNTLRTVIADFNQPPTWTN
jgi:GGDEF domain-containing protein